MSSTFEFYKTTIQSSLNEANSLLNSPQFNQSNLSIQDVQQRINQAKAALIELNNVVVLLSANEQAEAKRQISHFRSQIHQIQEQLQTQANYSYSQNRQELLRGSYDLQNVATDDHNIAVASQNFNETIDIGKNILSNLGSQKEKLLDTMNKTDMINGSVGSSSRLVAKMMKIQKQNKYIMWAVVILLVMGIVILFYVRYF